MPARKSTSTAPIYQLKVTLKGSKPPIWRRIQVRSDISLAKLHTILQVVMGWGDCHLHQFIVGGQYYGVPDPDFDMDVLSERTAKLNQIAPGEKSRFTYEYDFGLRHDVALLSGLAWQHANPTDPGSCPTAGSRLYVRHW